MNTHVTWQALRATYPASKRWHELTGDPIYYALHRPLAIALSWPLARVGMRPNVVSAVGLALALALPASAWLGAWGVALCVLLIDLLDGIDGTLARLRGTTSRRGAFLDSLTDRVASATSLLAMALLATSANGRVAGIVAAVVTLLVRFCDDHLRLTLGRNPIDIPPDTERLDLRQWLIVLFGGLRRLWPLLLIPCAAFGLVDTMLFVAAAHVVVIFVFVLGDCWRALR